jgi:hypothetical protein
LAVTVPGLSSGHEFYLQLLDQFQAVSYGDQLFAMYIVIPLSMKQPVAFRRYRHRFVMVYNSVGLWGEGLGEN